VQQAALDTVALMAGSRRNRDGHRRLWRGEFRPPIQLALAFARLADPSGLEDVALRSAFDESDAMMAHPELVGGDRRRFDTELMRARPGRLVSKAGAEGVKAVGVLRNRTMAPFGLAVKIEDGDLAHRAGDVATSAALARLGVLDSEGLTRLGEHAAPRISDPRGEIVGEVRAVLN
jgi:L-asparaginase II